MRTANTLPTAQVRQGSAVWEGQLLHDWGWDPQPRHCGAQEGVGKANAGAKRAPGLLQLCHAPSVPADVSTLLPCVALFAHLISDTILQGSATSHMAPMEPADRECCHPWGRGSLFPQTPPSALPTACTGLLETCKQCGSEAISYLSSLQDPGSVASANCTAVTNCLHRISAIGEVSAWASLQV